MGLLANYPIALASGMGENFFFLAVATGSVTGTAVGWRAALAAVFASGVLFLGLGAFRVRERIFEAIPSSLKDAIATGIGFFIAFIGLKEAGLIVAAPGTLVRLGHLGSPSTLLALGGLVLTVGLHVRGNPGAILFGILATAAAGLALGLIPFTGIVGRQWSWFFCSWLCSTPSAPWWEWVRKQDWCATENSRAPAERLWRTPAAPRWEHSWGHRPSLRTSSRRPESQLEDVPA